MSGVVAVFFSEFDKLASMVDVIRSDQAFTQGESARLFSATISICDAIYAIAYGDSDIQDEQG